MPSHPSDQTFPHMQDLLSCLPSQSREPTGEISEQPIPSARGQNLQTRVGNTNTGHDEFESTIEGGVHEMEKRLTDGAWSSDSEVCEG